MLRQKRIYKFDVCTLVCDVFYFYREINYTVVIHRCNGWHKLVVLVFNDDFDGIETLINR